MAKTEEVKIVDRLRRKIGPDKVTDVRIPRPRRIFARVTVDALREAIRYLLDEENFKHLSTISGFDAKENLGAVYHLTRGGTEIRPADGIEFSIKVLTPREKPTLPTITDIIPGSTMYEREAHDLLGIVFEGHPDLSRLILPDDWPEHIKPLRKEWTIEKMREELKG